MKSYKYRYLKYKDKIYYKIYGSCFFLKYRFVLICDILTNMEEITQRKNTWRVEKKTLANFEYFIDNGLTESTEEEWNEVLEKIKNYEKI